jgi:hypothetical protein
MEGDASCLNYSLGSNRDPFTSKQSVTPSRILFSGVKWMKISLQIYVKELLIVEES